MMVVSEVLQSRLDDKVETIINAFINASGAVSFTSKRPSDNCIRVLELKITLLNTPFTVYQPRLYQPGVPDTVEQATDFV